MLYTFSVVYYYFKCSFSCAGLIILSFIQCMKNKYLKLFT